MKTKTKIPQPIEEKMTRYSPFYQKVWRACFSIPKGQIRTYGWVAKKIRAPLASRAVGNALKMNPFAPTIPCHRVVRSDGKMGGYSGAGGVSTKRALLKKEGALQN